MVEVDLSMLSSLLADYAGQGRSALLPALHAAQKLYGYIPEPAAREIGKVLDTPLADVSGVIEFYSMLYSEPVGKTVVRVCTDPACALRGGEELLQRTCGHLSLSGQETTQDGRFTVERVPCLGLCEHAPAVLVNDQALAAVQPEQIEEMLQGIGHHPTGIIGGETRILTANCGRGKPTSLREYLAGGGYRGLSRIHDMTPAEIIAEVKASGLMGRGGAAFSTGVKWESAAHAGGTPKYIVCNADESEPGTFKDRVLLEEDPHQIVEGMSIAAYAIGAQKGYVYIRGEYPYAYRVMQIALSEAREAGYLGYKILGMDFDFDIELRLGAGAYIGGEETALFESIEGKRGFPRLKPPFPTTSGLFGKPTVINNVETLCNVPRIISAGAANYRKYGSEKSSGTKLFCLSGDLERPGLYEAPFGVTLRRLVEMAGGVQQGKALQAILLGGAAGVFVTAEQLDLPLTFEDLRANGLSLGSGVIMVFDEGRDLRQVLMRLGRFFAHESCGKCYPCQIGTQRQFEILQRIANGGALPGDSDRLADLAWTMTDASICGLGQTAGSAVLSAMKQWPDLFE